ncbi:MAG TPA: tannase/feruloyl esterase family alpha/beta hydrolase [Sphingobium sp.]|uniref:tannase/feruloyl esterase family alpha/beta hydrolase n=1 Tax=Sphingobium sp. TaxID=1912891 RepID=UPI002ED647CB
MLLEKEIRGKLRQSRWLVSAAALVAIAGAVAPDAVMAATQENPAPAAELSDTQLQTMCEGDAVQAIAATLPGARVTVQKVGNGPFKGATHFVAATDKVPAFCQVTGSFVTNAQTGKTANFLANFPTRWNGKYLQIGCSGHCGQFYVSNPAVPSVIVTTQGYPGQIMAKGYAAFATDEGHEGMSPANWAIKDGKVEQDYLDDFYYRADKVMADMGKVLTTAFYSKATGKAASLKRSYFAGCSGGGRDAMVVSSYFPEKFDGIIAGSPYDTGMGLHSAGYVRGMQRSPSNVVPKELYSYFDQLVKKQCDGLDGVKDGVIQNPLACNFRPDRDLPKCEGDKPGGQCFTKGQIETLSTMVTAMTDEKGRVIQPGFSVSELLPGAGIAELGDAQLKVFIHKNDPAFSAADVFSFRAGGPGPIDAFRVILSSEEAAKARTEMRLATGHQIENIGPLMSGKTKLMIWHNFSDERLTPISSINWYKQLAGKYGGYAKVQKTARLFLIPATAHCSIMGNGPNAFDALGTMEKWVEKGEAPEAIRLTVADHQFSPGVPKADAFKFPNATATVCKFPEMARYSGKGDVKDAANWSCSAKDTRGLQVGESGRQGGAL